jgi:hypothetical protein
MLAKPAPCEASAAPILANTSAHCASRSAGALPIFVHADLARDE